MLQSFFLRASCGEGASQALQSLSSKAGLPHLGLSKFFTIVHNYLLNKFIFLFIYVFLFFSRWSCTIGSMEASLLSMGNANFEQNNISEGACQFALAALEQVDEALDPQNDSCGEDTLNELATSFKGRLWANVFKFTLDINHFYDAYCAIISNPDEESKTICLRPFIIVLYERGAIKVSYIFFPC